MACNGLHYGILSNYNDTYFLKREETSSTTLYVTRIIQSNDDVNPTLRECVYYISQLAINDNTSNILDLIMLDNYSSNYSDNSDVSDNPDYLDDDYPLRKTGRAKK
ncbi:hypothetical protein Glove_164g9 [Diversispora epigaea]|uniref:Uncharacterized protein n=1 Tax=Diversispora epigaea TaxID=1348612 RepID=A0A397IVT6_9GLOM|nr:hypothetical protein Glove_164g9 [Diversispora epigaea]